MKGQSKNPRVSRFKCATSGLSLKNLLGRTRGILWGSLVVAFGVHLLVVHLGRIDRRTEAPKPLTTKFIKREPRLVKPLDLKKRPKPKPRPMHRRKVVITSKLSYPSMSTLPQPLRVLDNLAKPRAGVSRKVPFERASLEIEELSGEVLWEKEPQERINMALEMLDIDALDTGRYQAMVIQDPRDKKKTRGYFHLIIMYPRSVMDRDYQGKTIGRERRGMARLVAKMNDWTYIKADLAGTHNFESPKFFETPWVYLRILFHIEPTDTEREKLGQYMLSGGFVFADGPNLSKDDETEAMGYYSLKLFIEGALATQEIVVGRDVEFEALPGEHPIFHSYFDFQSPPIGYITSSVNTWGWIPIDSYEPVIHGLYMDNRLMCILTNQNYMGTWAMWGVPFEPEPLPDKDPRRQFEFGINTIMFALTQEGSITHQAMKRVE